MNMEKWLQLSTQAMGRDKIARLIQYTSMFLWDTLQSSNVQPGMVEHFKSLEYLLGTFRKLLRFGTCLDAMYASFHSIRYPDLVIRVTLTVSKISQASFLFADHFLWLARSGLLKKFDVKKWKKCANDYWLLSVVMNLCRDVYEIFHLFDLYKSSSNSGITRCIPVRIGSIRDLSHLTLHSYRLFLSHKDVFIDTVKNVCDLFIPLTDLGYTKLSARTIGILGMISSIAGLMVLVEPTARLKPS